MNKKEKKQFIIGLTNNVKKDILTKLKYIPKKWDGKQLRLWVAYQFSCCVIKGMLTKKQMREYNNDLLVNPIN